MRIFKDNSSDRGFTLIEVLITVGLLSVITLAVTQMLQGSFDIRFGLIEKNRAKHRLAVLMDFLYRDLSHAFIVSKKDQRKIGDNRHRTVFEINSSSFGDELIFTSMNHVPIIAGKKESELTYIYYVLKEDKDIPSITHLYRGSSGRLPEDLKELPNLRLLVRNIKSLTVTPWRGDEWARDRRWNSERRDWSGKMPRMVKIVAEAYLKEFESPEDVEDLEETPIETVESVVNLPYAQAFKELKEGSKTIKWTF